MKKDNHESIFQKNIQRAVGKGFISFSTDNSKITYHCSRDYTTSFKKPEEKVRASYFAELVLDYEYPSKKIDFEVIVPRRKPEDRADIIIYEDAELKKPYLVVECKKDGITDAEFKQAIEQAFGNANGLRAEFAAVIAGTTKTVFDVAGFKPSEREKNVVSDISVRYGKTPKYRFVKGDPARDLKIVSREELIRALEKSHDTVWQGGRLAPTTAFDEVSKLLFCKLKDEKGTKKGDTYKFQIGTHESAEDVYDRIDSIYQKAKREDAEVFREDIRLDAKIVYNVVEHLQGLAINKIDLDTKGIAFERFMQDFFKGKMGQFFTPRPIVEFAVKILNPERTDVVLDPACGSGGFLLNAMDLVKKFAEENYDEKEAWEHWHNFAMNNLYGIEINDQIARVCKMNMIIHDDGHTNVISTDSLRDIGEITDIHRGFKKNHFDIILTNPPFGATVKSTEKNYLEKYNLGKGKKNQKTEIMFIERCINFVKPKTGKIGIVLPDGILTNSSLQYVRNFIMERCQILAVVSLPQFAFTHYGAGVKSSLMFLRRKGENEALAKYPIFMAIAEHIGYDATGREDPVNDFDRIYEEYNRFIKENKIDFTEKTLIINQDEIGKRLDPLFYSLDIFSFLKDQKYEIKTIGEVTEYLKTGFAAGKQEQSENQAGGIIQIRPTNIDDRGQLYFDKNIYLKKEYIETKKDDMIQKGEVLFNNTNSQDLVGKTAYFDLEGSYFCSNHVTRIKVKENMIIPQFLKIIFNLYQKKKIFFNICTNWNNQSGVNIELLKTVKIPLPPLEIQNKIADEVKKRISEAERLKAEAGRIIEEAKKKVEGIILGEG